MTLLLIGFVGGVLAGISPCVLPVLPVVLLGSAARAPLDGGVAVAERTSRTRPVAIVLGLTLSFALITLFGTLLLAALHLPSSLLRWLGLAALVLVGLAMLVPSLERLLERAFARIPQRDVGSRGSGAASGFVLGLALGAVFVPCAGPVLAAIAVAGATGRIGGQTVALTVAFACGVAVPLLAVALAGNRLTARVRALQRRQRLVRGVAGVLVIALAVALTFDLTGAIQRRVPDYTKALGDSLGSGISVAPVAGNGSLQECQQAAYKGQGGIADCGRAPEFAGVSQWLGGPPTTMAAMRGDVVLVDFWAYSCINCQRELPHVEAWSKAYGPLGFRVVGVHTPEYAFEHDAGNIAAGARKLGLTFPVAVDNDYGTWNAYHNVAWPAGYLVDATGAIRHVSLGEGDYPQEEQYIRALLTAAHPDAKLPPPTDVPDTTPTDRDLTPETYLGAARQQSYGGSGDYTVGVHTFADRGEPDTNSYRLQGSWTLGDDDITAGAGAKITLSYHASEVYLDVGGTGRLTVTENGATRTIDVSGPPDIRTVASNVQSQRGIVTIGLSPGLQAYSFTFG
ncbi:cytochrome c biogenesis protein CcdA [Tsukamurella sp. 8F]|uniref:cytochrome c biogenesis protein CcdA n=1 Tax=unclassified Tsukamurella TaxID=2633480 RepID=UPI0023B95E2D|nr:MULTISPECIES: cytochrome c biogenesis protein CcdA [unclassified Tsukamurella]MDF0529641.1 cytochrome c biogenesis protein CcdA [Tsukamurella sp. 8J]MDF0585926.1 cytochrome c biogenesis protein CcdA [Tsukamurella sp. 8F]